MNTAIVDGRHAQEVIMSARKGSSGAEGQQPEALKTFGAASRAGSVKPNDQGLTAKPDTAPKRKSPSEKNQAAAEVLKAGAEGRPRTNAAAKKASDR
jgi:hypothetical protein